MLVALLPLAAVNLTLSREVESQLFDAPYPPTCGQCEAACAPAGTAPGQGHYDCTPGTCRGSSLGCNQDLCAQCSNLPSCAGDCLTAYETHGSCCGVKGCGGGEKSWLHCAFCSKESDHWPCPLPPPPSPPSPPPPPPPSPSPPPSPPKPPPPPEPPASPPPTPTELPSWFIPVIVGLGGALVVGCLLCCICSKCGDRSRGGGRRGPIVDSMGEDGLYEAPTNSQTRPAPMPALDAPLLTGVAKQQAEAQSSDGGR